MFRRRHKNTLRVHSIALLCFNWDVVVCRHFGLTFIVVSAEILFALGRLNAVPANRVVGILAMRETMLYLHIGNLL